MTTTTLPPCPPSARDFAVYEHVAVQGRSTRQAAQRFKLSQTRVCQVVRKVVDFSAAALPGLLETEIPAARRLALSENLAGLRLEHIYQESIAAWNDSRGKTWRVRERDLPSGEVERVRTTWRASGQTGYLDQAIKVTRRAMELAVPLPLAMLAEDDDDESDLPPVEAAADRDEERMPTAEDLFTVQRQTQQMIEKIVELRDDLNARDERIAAQFPPAGDCSPAAAAEAPAAELSSTDLTQVPAAQEEAATVLPAIDLPPVGFSGLFTQPPALEIPQPSRNADAPLTRRERRARQKRAAEFLRQHRSLAKAS